MLVDYNVTNGLLLKRNKKMNLTIITAAWHSENLPKVIKSIDNQTYQDFQHIIINDNNTDVRATFKGLCDGVRRHWIDFGVRTHYYGALARNTGIIIAFSYIHHSKRDIDNEWVVFHDDDNLWEPYHLESMIKALEANTEATMVASDAIWVGANDKTFRKVHKCKLKHGGCDLGQFMYKTSLFKKYGYFEPSPIHKHRYDWELVKKMTDGEGDKLVYTNKPTFLMNYKKK